MKKAILAIVVALCAMVMCLGFAACGGNSVDGVYDTVSVSVNGKEYKLGDEIPAGEVFENKYEITYSEMIVAIGKKSRGQATGSFTYTRHFGGGLNSGGGQWSEENGEISFNFHTTVYDFEMEYDGEDGLTFKETLKVYGKGNLDVVYNLKKRK